MTKLLLRWIVLAVSVVAASTVAHALNLGFNVEASDFNGFAKLMLGVLVLSLLNATLGRILKFLTLPLSCLTLGLFSLVINALVLWMAATLELGFKITDSGAKGFLAAFIASLLISFINGVLGVFLPDDKRPRRWFFSASSRSCSASDSSIKTRSAPPSTASAPSPVMERFNLCRSARST
jgi:putative membrane protein